VYASGVAASPAIVVERLRVNRGGRRVLDEITFDVSAGEIVGLLGPNGAGKTTTMEVLGTLLRADTGDVRIVGRDLRSDRAAVRACIGRVPQEVAVYPTLSGRENAVFFARLAGLRSADARREAAEALERLGLTSRADDAAGTYSSGMQRRLNLACGLLGSRPVLLLDEPTVGVDPQSLERIVGALRVQAAAGAAILCSTHQMAEAAELCDRVVLIDHGRVIALGTPAEIVAESSLGLVVEVVTPHRLPAGWLDGLAGVNEMAAPGDVDSASAGFQARAAIDDLDLAPRVLERAEAHGSVLELHVQRPTLHDAFLALTGRATRD
jgi:ABC-2 type transport system ATP-binding protein